MPKFSPTSLNANSVINSLVLLVSLLTAFAMDVAEAAGRPNLKLGVARYKGNELIVNGMYKSEQIPADGLVRIYDRKLGSLVGQLSLADLPAKGKRRTFRFSLSNPFDVPCAVRVAADGAKDKARKVRGAPKKACSTGKLPPVTTPAPNPDPTPTPTPSALLECEILQPAAGTALALGVNVFRGRVKANEAGAGLVKYEWDFAGAALERPTGSIDGQGEVEARANVLRSNSTYRVRLLAEDAQARRCEAAVVVQVGTPPQVPATVAEMAAVSQKAAPASGSAVAKPTGDVVVLPYEDRSMQCGTDAPLVPNAWVAYGTQASSLKAKVFEKAQKPVALGPDRVSLTYRAASSPKDPAGSDSINSTSRNLAIGTPMTQAQIQKTDMFETRARQPGAFGQPAVDYRNLSWVDRIAWLDAAIDPDLGSPDEGFAYPASAATLKQAQNRDVMPGVAAPYAANDPQGFNGFGSDDQSFIARLLPLTDIDDSGRVNPFPLMRVEATESSGKTAVTDAVMTTGRDLHCRECHAKGEIAATDIYKEHANHQGAGHAGHHGGPVPEYVAAASANLFDQENAALRNVVRLHDFHWQVHKGQSLAAYMENGTLMPSSPGKAVADGPDTCAKSDCHIGPGITLPFDKPLTMTELFKTDGATADPLSANIHRFHGRLQYDSTRTSVLRDEFGTLQRWDTKNGPNPNTLFPVVDGAGKPLPMEQNCLRCHGGQREQCYRDRMYTAGVTCYQCHGDMLAVGSEYEKPLKNPDGVAYRMPWLDEPNCGSCHTGDGNQGKDAANGFFSAGVKSKAFDDLIADPATGEAKPNLAAVPRQPDPGNLDRQRFTVPVSSVDAHWRVSAKTASGAQYPVERRLQLPLFRAGKDRHGDIACAACHGAAHAIWPNRDPSANDNVTANQLQGHSGHLVECSVCHSADAFANFDSLDGGRFSGLPDGSGILGGPHNMHPVNDNYWWLQVGTGSAGYGGWHDDYYRKPGFTGPDGNGVDQCAACHGKDHTGTRLSKAAVDRTFVLPTGITATWKAGQPIGCDQCHTLEHSFKGAPVGKGLPLNRPPSITPVPAAKVAVGKTYNQAISATDPDNNPLFFSLNAVPLGGSPLAPSLNIDPNTGAVSGRFDVDPLVAINQAPPVTVAYKVLVSDRLGGTAEQEVKVQLDCPPKSPWSGAFCSSPDILMETDPAAPLGLTVGQAYTNQIKVTHNLPVSFRLRGEPKGMTIDPASGRVRWSAADESAGIFSVSVIATDSAGETAQLPLSLTVCAAAKPWSNETGDCQSPISLVDVPGIIGVDLGKTYSFQLKAIHKDGLALSYVIDDSTLGIVIDAQGLMTWTPSTQVLNRQASLIVSDTNGVKEYQTLEVSACAEPLRFSASGNCTGPIEFDPSAIYGGDVGASLSLQLSITHRDGLPFQVTLDSGPPGLTVSPSGLVEWTPPDQKDSFAQYPFNVKAVDSKAFEAIQTFTLSVCKSPTHWDNDNQQCL